MPRRAPRSRRDPGAGRSGRARLGAIVQVLFVDAAEQAGRAAVGLPIERSRVELVARKDDPRSRWVMSIAHRRHKNVAAVALANKMARIAWALLTRGGTYDSLHGMTATA